MKRFYFAYFQDFSAACGCCHGEVKAENWEEAMHKGLSGQQDTFYSLAFEWPNSILACFELKDNEKYQDYKEVKLDDQFIHPKSRNFILGWIRKLKFKKWMEK